MTIFEANTDSTDNTETYEPFFIQHDDEPDYDTILGGIKAKIRYKDQPTQRFPRVRSFWADHKDDVMIAGTVVATVLGVAAAGAVARAQEEQNMEDYIHDMKEDVRAQQRYISDCERELAEIRRRKAAKAERKAARKARRS